MELSELFGRLTDEVDWELSMGTSYDPSSGDILFAVRVTLDGDLTRGAVARNPMDALEMAVESVLRGEAPVDEELESAAAVLKATLDELGFDRAVALLERLNNL